MCHSETNKIETTQTARYDTSCGLRGKARQAPKSLPLQIKSMLNEDGESKRLESNSSFVPGTTRRTRSTANRDNFEGKRRMSYQPIKSSSSSRRASSSSTLGESAQTTATIIGSASLKSRIKSSILQHEGQDNDTCSVSSPPAPPPFASPVTKRTQRAAAKLAERRKSSSPVGSPSLKKTGNEEEEDVLEEMESTSTLTPTTTIAADPVATSPMMSNAGASISNSKPKTAGSRTGNCGFASPPLSGDASAGRRRRFVSSSSTKEKSSIKKKGAASRALSASPSIGADGGGGDGRTPLKSLPLSVQREMERKAGGEALTMTTDTKIDSRRNLDKKTARLRYGPDFVTDLAKHRSTSLLASPLIIDKEARSKGGNDSAGTGNGVEIYVRKRPIFQYELERGDFDVVVIDNDGRHNASGGDDVVVINNCIMHSDMRRKLVKPTYFPCTQSFDETTTEDEIYNRIAKPHVQNAACGGISTIFMYGQTGSGKSYTMGNIETRTATGIFEELASAGRNADAVISVQFVELAGKRIKDLLGDAGEEVTLAEAKDGSVKLMGAETVEVKTPQELARTIELGKTRRATEATDCNGTSSRSHAVVQIQITSKGPGDTKKTQRGILNLLDLAGSERKNDSMYHAAERQKESNEINSSLWALKECTRTRALASSTGGRKKKNVIIPYRSNNLTRILRESFEREAARLCVVATVAPNATDTEHTMETLRFVSLLVGCEKNITEAPTREVVSIVAEMKKIELAPKQYSHEQLCSFLKRKKVNVTIPKKMDGKALMKLSSHQIRSHIFGGDKAKAEASAEIFNALRKENDRVAKLQRAERMRVSKARKEGSGHA